MHKEIGDILRLFGPITLKEMDRVKLLDRVESKYVFPADDLPGLLEVLREDYSVLDVNGVRQSRYETVYFDTDDLQLYRMHHNGRANRFKLRIRQYVDTGTYWYEVKVKNAKKRTVKERIQCMAKEAEALSLEPFRTLVPGSPDRLPDYHPTLRVMYSRITLVSKAASERLTIDTDLRYAAGDIMFPAPPMCIAEVKKERTGHSVFSAMMHQKHISTLRISKYCYGIILNYPNIRQNNFKPRLRKINKILGLKSTC